MPLLPVTRQSPFGETGGAQSPGREFRRVRAAPPVRQESVVSVEQEARTSVTTRGATLTHHGAA